MQKGKAARVRKKRSTRIYVKINSTGACYWIAAIFNNFFWINAADIHAVIITFSNTLMVGCLDRSLPNVGSCYQNSTCHAKSMNTSVRCSCGCHLGTTKTHPIMHLSFSTAFDVPNQISSAVDWEADQVWSLLPAPPRHARFFCRLTENETRSAWQRR